MHDVISRLLDATSKLRCLAGVDTEPRYLHAVSIDVRQDHPVLVRTASYSVVGFAY